jgi:competence protein ComFB
MYKLKNYMEELVINKTSELLKIMNICDCEKCRLDIMAIALNELPTKYVVSEKGELYTKLNELEQQFEIDVETAIIKAAVLVSKNPKHISTEE